MTLSHVVRLASATLLCGSLACSDTPSGPEQLDDGPSVPTPDPTLGKVSFLSECAMCHATRDGFDLAFFSFPDSTIIRRALGHVEMTEALDIAAYVGTLRVNPIGRHDRVFQPGGRQLPGDVEFAVTLLGADAWPPGLTAGALRSMNPLDVPVALAFPKWSFEESNLDWMPDEGVPEAILDYDGQSARGALAAYYSTGTTEWLVRAVQALRVADRSRDHAGAPCVVDDAARFHPDQCFEVRRWAASLATQHMLRYGMSGPVHPVIHDVWWDVGNVARKALNEFGFFENGVENWAVWMYLGWAFSPDRHASVYLGTGLARLELPRHATFVALRSLVVRPERGVAPFMDVRNAIRFSPAHWTLNAASFGYQELLRRLDAGWTPQSPEQLLEAIEVMERAWVLAARKLGSDAPPGLVDYHRTIMERLEGLRTDGGS